MGKLNFNGYAKLLRDWVVFSKKHLYRCPEDPSLVCYGNGIATNWGVQTNLKAFSAFAIAATLDEIDFSDTDTTKEEVLEEALAMLRYSLRTHLTGDFNGTDGGRWGHSWIYALGIERMFHAIEALEDYLTDDDRARLRAMMISESDFILNDYPIVAGLVENNKPESNIWNGAILYRTAVLYPDAENKDAYIEKAIKFFANGISIESDENSDEIVGGYRVGDLFVGANLFDSFSCNHHRYLNVGYMNICISNLAMLHFFMKSRNVEVHDMVYHNLKGLWELVRTANFDDGRLFRMGGDTRARYCYCQDYALVGWQLIEDLYGEDLTDLENGWLKILERECRANGDGSFLSERCGYFEKSSPLYYTRLESDRANAISMVLYWHKKYDFKGEGVSKKLSVWNDDYHGAAFVSGGGRLASFSLRAAMHPTELLATEEDSSLCEWGGNMCSRIYGVGNTNVDEAEGASTKTFDGGFIASATAVAVCDDFGEGQTKEYMARKHIAFAALPDDSTVISVQYADALNRVYLAESAGILFNVPNDVYNLMERRFYTENGDFTLHGGRLNEKQEEKEVGAYANIDGKIGIASNSPLTLVRRAKRQIEIKGRRDGGTLYCEEICADFFGEHRWLNRGDSIYDVAFAASLGNTESTKALYESLTASAEDGIRTVSVVGKDGVRYALSANFASVKAKLSPKNIGLTDCTNLSDGKSISEIELLPNEAVVYSCKLI